MRADQDERLARARQLLAEMSRGKTNSSEESHTGWAQSLPSPASEVEGQSSKKRRPKLGRRASFVAEEGEELGQQELEECVKSRASHQPDPAKISEGALHEAALRYLDRQDASVERVRQTLQRRILRYGDEETRERGHLDVELVLERLLESRVLDDERFARGLSESLRRNGASIPLLKQKLRQRGLEPELIDRAVEELASDDEFTDEKSATAYARKKRLRTRYNLEDPKERQKALASLARQGFSFDVACRALGI